MALLAKLKGYRTYLTIALFMGLVGVESLTSIRVPDQVYVLLGAAGLGFLRAAVSEATSAIGAVRTGR